MAILHYRLIDVFAGQPLSGNSLTLFELQEPLDDSLLLRIAQEMRQFESIFLWRTADPHAFKARMFTVKEACGVAGYPLMGAACALHAAHFEPQPEVQLQFLLRDKTASALSRRAGSSYQGEMNLGDAEFHAPLDCQHVGALLNALNLSQADLMDGLPLQVVSTGLPYLIVPVKRNLKRARITQHGWEHLLAQLGARFVYVLDVPALHGHSWDNEGRMEEIATGIAAGPAGAYLVKHGVAPRGQPLVLRQGLSAALPGRSSESMVVVHGHETLSVAVGGPVAFVGNGMLDLP